MIALSHTLCFGHCSLVRPEFVLPFSNRRPIRKAFLIHFFLFGPFFCSTAPQAFFRPNHISQRPARAGHVKAGRFFSGHRRLGLDMTEHDGRLVGLGRKAPPSVLVWPSGIANLCRLHRSLRGRARSPHHGPPEASAPQCPERDHRSVAGRIARSPRPVPAGTAFRHDGERELAYDAVDGAGCHWNG